MTLKNRVELNSQAIVIRDETTNRANTASRVGTMHVDTIDSMSMRVLPLTIVSGTTYTLLEDDSGSALLYTNASGCIVTVPNTLSAGHNCMHVQKGAGGVSFVGSGGMTIVNSDSQTEISGLNDVATTLIESSSVCLLSFFGGGGHRILNEGVPLPQRTDLNFVGTGVIAVDDSPTDATIVTINASGGGYITQPAYLYYVTFDETVGEPRNLGYRYITSQLSKSIGGSYETAQSFGGSSSSFLSGRFGANYVQLTNSATQQDFSGEWELTIALYPTDDSTSGSETMVAFSWINTSLTRGVMLAKYSATSHQWALLIRNNPSVLDINIGTLAQNKWTEIRVTRTFVSGSTYNILVETNEDGAGWVTVSDTDTASTAFANSGMGLLTLGNVIPGSSWPSNAGYGGYVGRFSFQLL